MRKVYIVLTFTGTILSRIVKLYTKKEYSHVSISLDKNLNHMYSFGRIHAYNPFSAGFVQESPSFGTFKRFKNTRAKIYELEVEEKDYKKIEKIIHDFNHKKDDYGFNMIGLAAVMIPYRIKRKKHFYCAEFVKYVFDQTSLNLSLPEIVKPEDFQKIQGLHEIYSGLLSKYNEL